MTNQRLRNITTGRLHTEMGDIYEDVELLTGEEGVMTHQLPNAIRAMEPWLKKKVADLRFWDGKYDPSHEGETPIEPMNSEEKAEFFKRYGELPHPFSQLGTQV